MMMKIVKPSQQGIVLVSALLLLIVVVIMSVTMLRSFTVQEKIAGSFKEKQRALQAAESAQQWAEYYLVADNKNAGTSSGVSGSPCSGTADVTANGVIPICDTELDNPSQLPWTSGGGAVGSTYTLPDMSGLVTAASGSVQNTYATSPIVYIADETKIQGLHSVAGYRYYKVVSVGFGAGGDAAAAGSSGSTTATAIVESYYAVLNTNPGG